MTLLQDMLISLKSLVLQRAKVIGHEGLAQKFDLKMLRALGMSSFIFLLYHGLTFALALTYMHTNSVKNLFSSHGWLLFFFIFMESCYIYVLHN